MLPAALDDLFSLTMWRSDGGFMVGVQREAGDLVHYERRRTASEAIAAAVAAVTRPTLSAPPY